MTTVFARRIASKRPPFVADREHLHHIFLTAGFSVAQTVVILVAGALLLASIGIAGLHFGMADSAMLALSFAFLVLYYCTVSRCWTIRRFLGRGICRRSGKERRAADHSSEAICQRGGEERRTQPG